MGMLVEGQWRDAWYDTKKSGGRFVRTTTSFRDQVSARAATPGRYHLYVSYACPWAHRTLIVRALKGLEELVDVSVVSPLMGANGWTYDLSEGSTGDKVKGRAFHHEIYTDAHATYTGRVTVPVLWDTDTETIVNNESSEIVRIFNQAFDAHVGSALDLYPEALRAQIDAWNDRIYPAVNNGVYKAGFATTQEAYEEAYEELFAELDHLDAHLANHRYLCGERLTEADIRLFPTLIRFDAVYHGHFKCNRQRLEDFEHLPGYVRDIYQLPGVAETVRFDHIKTHYYASHDSINPTRIVPAGPNIDYGTPHGRDAL